VKGKKKREGNGIREGVERKRRGWKGEEKGREGGEDLDSPNIFNKFNL
jgi:hypothetical protein